VSRVRECEFDPRKVGPDAWGSRCPAHRGLVHSFDQTCKGRHFMSKSTILTVCLSISVGYIVATSLNRSSAGQPPLPKPVGQEGQVWRYQLMATENSLKMGRKDMHSNEA
jgi:hypothetical protein